MGGRLWGVAAAGFEAEETNSFIRGAANGHPASAEFVFAAWDEAAVSRDHFYLTLQVCSAAAVHTTQKLKPCPFMASKLCPGSYQLTDLNLCRPGHREPSYKPSGSSSGHHGSQPTVDLC